MDYQETFGAYEQRAAIKRTVIEIGRTAEAMDSMRWRKG